MQFTSPPITVDAYPQATIVWRGEASYRNEMLAAVEKQRSIFQRVVSALEGSGNILTPAEAAALKPRIEITIHDDRVDQSVALPSVFENDAMVVVRTTFTRPLE